MAFTTVVFYVVFRNNDRDDVAASMNIVADVEKGNGEAKPTPQLTNSAHGSRESHLSMPTESSREDKEIELTAISLSQSTRVTQRNTTAVP
jgi:hypothetical protein